MTSSPGGRREIVRLRALAEARLGDAFDVRGFHGAVLSSGAVPLSVLEPPTLSLTVVLAVSATEEAVSLTCVVAFCTAGMPAISRNFASIWT